MLLRRHLPMPDQPAQQDPSPATCGQSQTTPSNPAVLTERPVGHQPSPEEREKGQNCGGDRDLEAALHSQDEGQSPVAPALVFFELIELSQRVEAGEERS